MFANRSASGPASTPKAGERRFALKAATDAAHARVEGIVEGAGMFATREGYARFLAASCELRAHFENLLDISGAAGLWPVWPERKFAHLIAADIADLGGIIPAVEKNRQPGLTRAELLGVLYVLEGSSLGARVLVGKVEGMGLSGSFGARHLFAQAGDRNAWRSFVALMDEAPEQPSTEAALSTFDAFAEAYARQSGGRKAAG